MTKATPDRPGSTSVTLPIDADSVNEGDRLLVGFFARSLTGNEGSATSKVQISGPPYSPLGTTDSARFGREWQEIHQPLIASREAPAGKGEMPSMKSVFSRFDFELKSDNPLIRLHRSLQLLLNLHPRPKDLIA